MTVLTQFLNFVFDNPIGNNPIGYAAMWLIFGLIIWYSWDYFSKYSYSQSLPTANASTGLIPRFDRSMGLFNTYIDFLFKPIRFFLKKKVFSLTVVGGDGRYFFSENGNTWASWLADKAKQGVKINYIFTIIDSEVEKKIKEKFMYDNIHFHLVKTNEPDLIKRYSTYHPTLLDCDNEKSRRIWLEKKHLPDSPKAEYVDYLTPKSEYFCENFDKLKKDIDFLLESSTELILKAA